MVRTVSCDHIPIIISSNFYSIGPVSCDHIPIIISSNFYSIGPVSCDHIPIIISRNFYNIRLWIDLIQENRYKVGMITSKK